MSSIDNKINHDDLTPESLKTLPKKETVASTQEEKEKSLEMKILTKKIGVFCENNRVDKQYSGILEDFFLEENKDKLEEIIIAEDLEEAIKENREIVQGYKDLISSDHPDNIKILDFNRKQGNNILGAIFLTHGVTGESELQAIKSKEIGKGELPSDEQEKSKNTIKVYEYMLKDTQAKTDKEVIEIDIEIDKAKGNKVEIDKRREKRKKLLENQKEFAIIIKSKIIEYENNIEEIKAKLKKETEKRVGIEPLQDTGSISGLKDIRFDINIPKVELNNVPNFLPIEGGKLGKYPNPMIILPPFQNKTKAEALVLSEKLLYCQLLPRLSNHKYTNNIPFEEQRRDIADMQAKGRLIPFGPDDGDKEATIKKELNETRETVGSDIQQGLIDLIKQPILEKSNKEFIGHFKTAESGVLCGSLGADAQYYPNGNFSVPYNLINPFSTPFGANTSLGVKGGNIFCSEIVGGRGNSPLLLKEDKEIGSTKTIIEIITENAGLIDTNLLSKVLGSKEPKKTLEEKLGELKINNTIDSGKLGEEMALSGSQHLLVSMLYGGHEPSDNLQNKKTTTSPLDGTIKAILGKDDEKKGLQPDNPIYKDMQSVLGSMKGWDIAMHNRFSKAISTLSEVLKNPETEGNIGNIIASSEDSNNHKLAYIASLSQGSRKKDSVVRFIKLFMEGEKGEFNGATFCNTIDELDFAINQGGGIYSLSHEPEEKEAKKTIEENNGIMADRNLEDALNNEIEIA